MVRHKVYYVSTQYLKNGDFRDTTPNGGHSKIMGISFRMFADLDNGKTVEFSAYLRVRGNTAYLEITGDDELILNDELKILWNGNDIKPVVVSSNIKKPILEA